MHAAFSALRTFLLWFEDEVEPENWTNPIRKLKAPKLAIQPLKPVDVEDVSLLVKVCNSGSNLDYRDIALLMFLLVTGARAHEILNIDIEDIDLVSGATLIERGKGSRSRTVFLGKVSRKALRTYLKRQIQVPDLLWQ